MNAKENMTADKVRELLEDLGVSTDGAWKQTTARDNVESPMVAHQKKALRKIEALLVNQLEQDKQRVADLHIAMQRIKHGGGQ
jgi:hypothetical protein